MMVKTRSKANERDKTSPTKAFKKHQVNIHSAFKGSNSNKKSSVSSSNVTSPPPLRRSTRETPTKKTTHLSLTPSPNKKTLSMDKLKSVSAGTTSSLKSTKKMPKGKEKFPAKGENKQTCKRNLNSISNSSSPSAEKEEGSSTKRRRVLLHAKTYKELFKPHSNMTKLSPPVEKAQAVEGAADEIAVTQVNTHAMVDVLVQEASCSREYSSGSKSANEATPYAQEGNTTKKVLGNHAEEPVVSVAEDRAECTSDGMNCEILSATQCNVDDPCIAGSTGERMVDPEKVVIAGNGARHSSEEHQTGEENPAANACFACRKPGVLLCCEGKNCKKTYHLSCLDPPLQSSPPGAWLCISCVQKRIQYGVYAVCDGIECIWDVKDARTENGKLYLVKYKNTAHVHNRWVPETEIAAEAPDLLSKFNWRMQKEKNPLRWKQEWTEPQRLLMKRPLMSQQAADEFYDGLGGSMAFCNTEWLVKWRDLGYEHATWELQTSPFLCSENGDMLINAFESRRVKARLSSYPERISRDSRELEVKQAAMDRLEKLPDGFPTGLDSEHLHSVNQLRLFWHKSQNAVFIDEQERVIKTILFIMSVIEDICRPILIVSSSGSLPLWESKFQRLAPSINLVSYTGTKRVRKLIQDMEFYEEGGCVMFQVLLSHPDAMVEDFEMLDSIGWEAVIVDECQNTRISKYLEKFKNLSADFRLLLLSSPLKDSISEYQNMLSYLDPNHGIANTGVNKSDVPHLKEKLAHHVAYERKDETSKVVEYWVPARFSKVQLELYCSTLLLNSCALRSSSKIDQVGALRETLISLRKCCDHPYLVYQDLQAALTKEKPVTEILNVGVYASGKLLLLDKLLHELRKRDQRVLIMFQTGGGSGRNQIGDFLDDFLRQRFGADAYEHVERGLLNAKKQIAMNNFNDKSKGRFVFLIENRACQQSLKLSGVDAVLIYGSDWNPVNDIRNIQKINIQPARIPIFRFYSPCAVEEKVLNLTRTRQDFSLDSTLQGVVPAISQSLLSWGAEHLFSLLPQLHLQPDDAFNDYRSACFSPDDMAFIDTVIAEIMDKICGNSSDSKTASLLVEAQLSGDSYSQASGLLIGEKKGVSSLQVDPPLFWSALLEGKSPQWRFIQSDGPSQRIRRRVRPFDNSENPLEAGSGGVGETDELRKKRKKNVGDASMNGSGVMFHQGKAGTSSPRNPSAAVSTWNDLSGFTAGPTQQEISNQGAALPSVEVGANLRSTESGIHLILEPQLLNLCRSAGFPDYVKTMARMLLEYVMNNFKVDNGGDAAILQTLVISLCWRAASLFKHWVDPLQLTALASEKLQYNCKVDVVESVYCRLKVLKVEFQEKADDMVANQIPSMRFYNKLFKVPKQEVIILPESPPLDGEIIETPAPLPSQSRCRNETEVRQDNAKEKLFKAQLDLIEKVCSQREEALVLKQQKEFSELEQFKRREKIRLRTEHQSQLERLSGSSKEQMVIKLKEEFDRKMQAFEAHVGKEGERLQALHTSAKELERSIKEKWVENSKLGNLEDDFDNVPSSDCCEFTIQEFKWDPPTPLIHENNFSGRAGNENISPGLSNHIPPHCQETRAVAAAQQGGTAIDSSAQHRESEISYVERERNTMMEQEIQSVDGLAAPAGIPLSGLPVEMTESIPPSEAAELSTPAEAAELITPAEDAELTRAAEAAELTTPAEAAVLTTAAEAAELTTAAEAAELTTAAEDAELTTAAKAAELTTPEAAELTTAAEDAELTTAAEAAELTTAAEAAELTTAAEAAELTTPAEAAELTPQAEATTSTPSTAVALPAVVDVAITDGITAASTSDIVLPVEPLNSVPRDVATQGRVSQDQMPLPVLSQNSGRQNTQVNISNVVSHGHETANENGTTIGLRSEASYNSLWQILPLASPMVFPHGLHADPLRNELTRIKHQEDFLAKRHEAKRTQLKMEMDEEMERLRRKYEEILQEEDNTFQQQKLHLEDVYKKVFLNQSLAEEFRAKFIEHRASSASSSAITANSSQFRIPVSGPRSQLPLQHRGPGQIQRGPSAAAVPQQVIGNANGSPCPPSNSSRPPSVTAFRIPSTSQLRSSVAPPTTSWPPFSPVSTPPRPGAALRTEHRAPAPHLARARPHMSATVPASTTTSAPSNAAAIRTIEQFQSLLAQSQEGTAAHGQIQVQNQSQTQTQTQNHPAEALLPAFGNSTGSGHVAVGDGVVCLSDDD